MKYLSFILFAVIIAFITLASLQHVRANAGVSTSKLISNKVVPCKTSENNTGKQVILRFDDIADYSGTQATIELTKVAQSKKVPVVYGVIPTQFGKDAKLTSFISQNNCDIELALHGYSGTKSEFRQITEDESFNRVIKGKQKLSQYSDQKIVTFAAPNSDLSETAVNGMKKGGIEIISNGSNGLYDISVPTYDYSLDELMQPEDIIRGCADAFAKNNLCVVLVHPYHYTTDKKVDKTKIEGFKSLLEFFESNEVSFTTFKAHSSK